MAVITVNYVEWEDALKKHLEGRFGTNYIVDPTIKALKEGVLLTYDMRMMHSGDVTVILEFRLRPPF